MWPERSEEYIILLEGGGGGGGVGGAGCRASLAGRDRNLYRCHPQLTVSSPQHSSFSVVPGCSP